MSTWTTEMWLAGMPEEILQLLTEPDAIARWAPIPFEVLELDTQRLQPGTRGRVAGYLAGRALEFNVEILAADDGVLSLVARGPVSIVASYRLRPAGAGSSVQASVSVSGHGVVGRVLARAVDGMLAAGALRTSVARMGQALEPALAA